MLKTDVFLHICCLDPVSSARRSILRRPKIAFHGLSPIKKRSRSGVSSVPQRSGGVQMTVDGTANANGAGLSVRREGGGVGMAEDRAGGRDVSCFSGFKVFGEP